MTTPDYAESARQAMHAAARDLLRAGFVLNEADASWLDDKLDLHVRLVDMGVTAGISAALEYVLTRYDLTPRGVS